MEKYAAAVLDSQEITTSNMIINGIPQGGIKQKVYYIHCSECNRVLAQFNPGESLLNIIDYSRNNLKEDIKYCPTCGSKLSYNIDLLEYTAHN